MRQLRPSGWQRPKAARARCQACERVGCDEGYEYFVSEIQGKPTRVCLCCDQLWPSGKKNPEY